MTKIQQVLFEVAAPYFGHPYFVTGHALFNALARRVDAATREALCVSHGVFVPGEYGEFPDVASQDGYGGKLGKSLPEVSSYDDLFLFRDAAQRWLLDKRPRDAHNVLDVQTHGGRLSFAPTCWFGRPPANRNRRRSVSWYVQCYVHGDGEGVVPLDEDVLDGLRVGGARNYGFGELSVADTQLVDLDALDYSRLKAAQGGAGQYELELVSPFVVDTDAPNGDAQSVPWWWGVDSIDTVGGVSPDGLRRRTTRLVDGSASYAVETVDHGQVVGYAGDDPVATALNGVLRVGTHSRFGFGELRVRPPGGERVSVRAGGDVTDGEVS
ncbi:hypothetical protein [Salinibaculum rarum]|uniref:hypothetical protein n=1 Tax=Salinibaculum rarum TaxID=3058903 RepID=UPI00265E0277|nr:hypothetical protein [Salinibaculum sp. KK48]